MFEKRLAMVVVLLTVAQLLVASCAQGRTEQAPGGSPGPATKAAVSETPKAESATATPRYGGILTSYIPANPASLDAQQESALNTAQIVAPLYSNLVQADPLTLDKYVPGLAEKWQMSPDGLTWTFDMRQGVKFHDGSAFTIDDALFTLKRIIDPPKGVLSNMSFLLKPVVKSMDKQGNTLKITLNYPFALMLDVLGDNYSPVYSQKYVEKNGDMKKSAMGTGPFKLKSYSPGIGLEGVKNNDFWAKGRPFLDGYRFLIISDPSTRLSAFRTGKVNITGRQFATLMPDEMDTVKKENSQIKFFPSPSLTSAAFFMNMRKPPFQDLRVRKAIYLALDRQAAIKVLAQGQGTIGKVFVDPWGVPTDELLKRPGYRQPKDADIAEAKKLMLEAGYPDGFDLTILARNMWQSKDAAVFMTGQVAQLGIKAKVQTMEDAVFWETGRKAAHEAMVYTPITFIADPHWQGRFWAPNNPINYSGNDDDKEFADMWDQQIKIVDVDKRKALIRKIEEHIFDTLPGISIVWFQSYIGVRPEVRNFAPGMGDRVGNTLEEIWLAK